jgi:DNA mismatch repair protein MutL
MSKIRVLPDNLANKIAAGEVVERPASIVKELLENSIDAGATRIEVSIESGGRRLIRVSDNGEGMNRDDAILAFERHATSKIRTAEDLEAILTLGFRGEALASIASVSRARMRTQRDADLVGTEVEISGGKMYAVRDTAIARGTEIQIKDIFFNVPARRKFLKSEATESFHIANLVTHYGLANPQLSFKLINNGRETLSVVPAADLRERAYQIFGDAFIGDLIEVERSEGEMVIRGFVSSPSAARTTRDNQYFFVNRRYVKDRLLARALSEGFRAMIPSGTFPSAMLFVEVPPQDVDVNVHPAKTEVRFLRSAIVYDLMRDAIRGAIARARAAATRFPGAEPKISALQPAANVPTVPILELAPQPPPVPEPKQRTIDLGFQRAFTPAERPTSVEPLTQTASPHRGCLQTRRLEAGGNQLKPAENLTLYADEISILGQIHSSFIAAVDRSGVLLIDQHVAHERILFELHWNALRRNGIEVQRQLIPETFDLTPAQAAAFDKLLPELEQNGFEITRLSGRTVVVKAVPAILEPGAAQSLLTELMDSIEEDRRGLSLDELRAEIAAGLACRAAVKINMPLSQEKMRWLVDELLRMQNPSTCPHGRPIILRITMREMERAFQRI